MPIILRQASALTLLTLALTSGTLTSSQSSQSIAIRGHALTLRVYGSPQNTPTIVSSGDGGWIHLAPHVAQVLAARGFYVVGFDVRAYLASFTAGSATLGPGDEPGDYRVLAEFASRGNQKKPVLVGVSEGAGLSVLAATDPQTRSGIAGVVGLGLPDANELGWRWKDAVIYLTHKVPNEPTFSVAAIVGAIAPLPLAAIHATHDEFVPIAEIERILQNARGPKKLWIVTASDHRFSDNLNEFDGRLFEAVEWVAQNAPR